MHRYSTPDSRGLPEWISTFLWKPTTQSVFHDPTIYAYAMATNVSNGDAVELQPYIRQSETPIPPPQYPITPFGYGGQYGPSFQVNQPCILPNPGVNLSGTWVPQNAPPLTSNLHGGPHQFQQLFPQPWQSNPTGSAHTCSKSVFPSSDRSWKVSKSTKKPERPRSLVIRETRTPQQRFMSDNT